MATKKKPAPKPGSAEWQRQWSDAWHNANPGKLLPGAQPLGSVGYQRAWQMAWEKANPGKTLPGTQRIAQDAPAAPTASEADAGSSWQDAAYAAELERVRQQRDAELGRLGQEQTNDTTDYQEALRRLLQRKPEDLQNTDQSFNKSGLFFSGQLNQARDQVNADYTRQQGDMDLEYQRRSNARKAAREALNRGASLDEAAAAAAAVDRSVGRDSTYADANALVKNRAVTAPVQQQATGAIPSPKPPPAPRPTTTPPRVTPARPYQTVTARGSVFHAYTQGPKKGRRVAVRPVSGRSY